MRVAVVFDTAYSGWDHPDHERQMEREVGAWKSDEPEMEYQIAHALRERGHEVRLLGVWDDLQYLSRCLREWGPRGSESPSSTIVSGRGQSRKSLSTAGSFTSA
jgi:hypothetical protein